MDTAELVVRFVAPVNDPNDDSISVFSQTDQCYKCSLLSVATIDKNTNKTIPVQTNFPTTIKVVQGGEDICTFKYMFAESATYKFVVSTSGENSTNCSEVQEMTPDDNAYLRMLLKCHVIFDDASFKLSELLSGHDVPPTILPSTAILFAFLLFFGLAVLYGIGKWLFRKYQYALRNFFSYEHFVHSDLGNPGTISNQTTITNASVEQSNSAPKPAATKARLRSLDTFRGISLTVMIFVNYGGGGYWFFSHSAWNGLTVADLVFPWFVWIMGVALAFSFRGPLSRGESKFWLFVKVVRRTVILFVFGLIINTNDCNPTALPNLRIMGVLQRLALSYFFVATLEIIFGKRAMTLPPAENGGIIVSFLRFSWDIFGSIGQWLVILAIVALHTCITFLLPVPDCPTGYLGPGGLADESKYYNCTGGAAQYVDRVLLGEEHMYGSPTCKDVYKTVVPYDPEGLLGCLTSFVMCYLGLHAGRVLTLYPTTAGRIGRWLNWALVWGLIAGILCGFSQEGGVIPVNKNFWSLSFILALSSMALILLSALYLICDTFQMWSGAPFIYPGMNSIVVYMCHEMMASVFPVTFVVDNTHLQKLAINLWGVSLWTMMAAFMYYQDVFIAI